MISNILGWYNSLPNTSQTLLISALISAIVSLTVFFLGWVLKFFQDKYSINYKLKREYVFDQRKNIKLILSKTKTPLIKAAEELNYRLWNLSSNIGSKWHNIDESEWKNGDKYYLKSFTYRIIVFLYWIQKAEESVYSFDFNQADKSDNEYLKYLKTLKHFFCTQELLKELGYTPDSMGHHFYKDELVKFTRYVEENEKLIDYSSFEEKYNADSQNIRKLIIFITNIKEDKNNKNYNVIKAFHIFLILFLNKYGLKYHYTDYNKLKELVRDKYNNIQIKKGLYLFLERNKVLAESKKMIKLLELKKNKPNT